MRIVHQKRKVIEEAYFVEISGMWRPHLYVYEDEDRTVRLNDDIMAWLEQHAPYSVSIDRGDFGEGTPDFKIKLPSRAAADAFVRAFGAPAEGEFVVIGPDTVEFTATTPRFCDGHRPSPKMIEWLTKNASDYELKLIDDYDVSYPVYRFTFHDPSALTKMFAQRKAWET